MELGNLDAKRDWGFAKEYVEGMYIALQREVPDTFVLATGRTHTVRDFVNLACEVANIPIVWEGEGVNERAIDKERRKTIVSINPKFYRPAEVDILIGDATRAKQKMDWEPKTSLQTLCQLMVEADLRRNKENNSF